MTQCIAMAWDKAVTGSFSVPIFAKIVNERGLATVTLTVADLYSLINAINMGQQMGDLPQSPC